MADVSVRPARAGDADEIARVQVLAWRIGYERLVPREVLAALDAEAIAAEWRRGGAAPPAPPPPGVGGPGGARAARVRALGPAAPDEERGGPGQAAVPT